MATGKTAFADTFGYQRNNATDALQAALSDPTVNRVIVRDMGNPWYVDQTVFVGSNKTVVFRPGVVVQAKPGSFLDNRRPMIRAVNVRNVKLIGQGQDEKRATFKMNRREYQTLEYGHALDISAVTNYTIKGLRFTGAGGDGIHIGGAAPEAKSFSENGLISNVVADNNRRQGLSIISVKGLTVRNSTFRNTRGTAPSAGIDIEPNVEGDRLQNIKLQNLQLMDNRGAGLKLALGNLTDNSKPISIDAHQLWIENNQNSGISVALWDSANNPEKMPDGVVNIRQSQVLSTTGQSNIENYQSGILLHEVPGSSYDSDNVTFNFDQVTVANSGNDPDFYNPIHIRGFGGTRSTKNVGNVSFNNVVVRDRFQRDIIRGIHGRSNGVLEDISGNVVAFNSRGVTVDYDAETKPRRFTLTVRDGDRLTGNELITNGRFDSGKRDWDFSSNRNLSIQTRRGNDRALKIEKQGGTARQILADPLIPSEDYVLSGRGFLTEKGDSGVIGIRYCNEQGQVQSLDTLTLRNTQELELSLGLTTPRDFSSAELFVRNTTQGNAVFWVDDLSLTAQKGGVVNRGF